MLKSNIFTVGVGFSFLVATIGLIAYFQPTVSAEDSLINEYKVISAKGTDGQTINVSGGLSDDAKVFSFHSNEVNLPNSGGAANGLYVYNLASEDLSRVDVSTSGTLPNGSILGMLQQSNNGRYITFSSAATNLIDGTSQASRGIYKRDTQVGITSFVANGYSGGLSQNWDNNLAISDDGRFILLSSRYITGSYPYPYAVIRGDLQNGSYVWTELAKGNDSAGSTGARVTAGDMSCDGSLAVYATMSGIELADFRGEGVTKSVVTADSTSSSPIISCNGRYILYATSNRTEIAPTPAGMNANQHLVRYDRITGLRTYIDSNSSGVFSNGTAYASWINTNPNAFGASVGDTGDVVFRYNGISYLKHLSDGSGTLEPIARRMDGSVYNLFSAQLSSDSRFIQFVTDPYNLGLEASPTTPKTILVKTGF